MGWTFSSALSSFGGTAKASICTPVTQMPMKQSVWAIKELQTILHFDCPHTCRRVQSSDGEASLGKVANSAMPRTITAAVSHKAPLKPPVACAMAPATTGAIICAAP